MEFTPTAEIDLDALRHNLGVARRAAPDSRTVAVIKADGYGHGLQRVALALSDTEALAVARIEEALLLRQAGVPVPIIVLGGARDATEFEVAAVAALEIVVHHPDQLARLAEARPRLPLRCWIKVETGMHRLGVAPEAVAEMHRQLSTGACRCVGLMTHLANADDPEDPCSRQQVARLIALNAELKLPLSIANSAGILACPEARADWNRPGLMLYGASPFAAGEPLPELQPVMTLRARLVAVNACRAGDAVGYGGTFRCPEDMAVGVVAIGYGDGYPREVAGGTPALLNGHEVPIVGRVSMDMLTLDLRSQPEAAVGDEVVLWGRGLPIERIARAAGTIPYTLLCGVTRRVRFVERDRRNESASGSGGVAS